MSADAVLTATKNGQVGCKKTLAQAALDAGFDSPSHLAATFKRMFGISFSQFLKSAE